MRFPSIFSVFLIFFLTSIASLSGQSLSVLSGNGQLVQEQFLTTALMKVQAKDAAGRPAAGVAVTWAITQGSGTLVGAASMTDADGIASTNFLGTSVNPSASIVPATVTASSAFGTASFVVTTTISRQLNGTLAAPPLVELINPSLDTRTISGRAGSTLPGGVVVRVTVQSGAQSGAPVPNVGVRLVDALDPLAPAAAACAGPGGLVLTGADGRATCDVVLGLQAGSFGLKALAGESQNTPAFTAQITPGVACTFALSATNQTIAAAGATGSVNVTAPAGCGWTATSNASWIGIASGANGSGNGAVTYSVAANPGSARAGALLIAGQTYTVNQSAPGGTGTGPLTITTGTNLPTATVGAAYVATFTATGGMPPYAWSSGTLPAGFFLVGTTGILTGTPQSVGNFTLSATVMDSAGASVTQMFSVNVVTNTSTSLTITNTGFPNGVVGQPYQQPLTSSGGCVTPFSPVPVFTLATGALPQGLSIVTGVGGGFSLGGTPTAAGTSTFTLAVQDACAGKATAGFTLTILSVAGSAMTVTPASLAFNVVAGSTTPPAVQPLSIGSSGTAFQYTATATTTTGGNWLALGAATGTTPGSITAGVVNYGQLPAGTYNGTIAVTSSAGNSPVIVPVTLTIAAPAVLTVFPTAITFTQAASGSITQQQAIQVGSGQVAVAFTATPTTLSGGPWLFLSSTAGTTPATLLASVNSSGLAAGTYTGSILIAAASGGSQTVSVTLTVPASATLTVSPGSLSFTAPSLTGAPPSQVLSVASSAGSTNFTVTATSTGTNWLMVTPQSGTTPAGIAVSVNASALPVGSYSGMVTITPVDMSIAPVNVAVLLTIGQSAPAVKGITNAASFAPGRIAPGEIITIFGSGIGPTALAAAQLDANGNVASADAGTQVLFDGIAAPIIYTSDTQVAVIVPYEVFGRESVVVQLSYRGVVSNSVNLLVADSSPAIFTNGIVNLDGSVNSLQSGTDPGSIVLLYATGEGQTDPSGPNGRIITADMLPRPRLPVSVRINDQPADVLYAGGAPGFAAGLLQVNVRLPANLPRQSQVPLVLTIGTQSSPPVSLSIK